MMDAERNARDRAHRDRAVIMAAHQWTLVHFGGDVTRAAWFFDELAQDEGRSLPRLADLLAEPPIWSPEPDREP